MARHHVQHRDQLAQRVIDTLGVMAEQTRRVDPDLHRVLQLARGAIMARHGPDAWQRWCQHLIDERRAARPHPSDAERADQEQALLDAC